MTTRTYISIALAAVATLLIGAAPFTRSREIGWQTQGRFKVELVEVGGCDYVIAQGIWGYAGGVAITHHAACNNPVHK